MASADMQWLFYSGERILAHGTLVCLTVCSYCHRNDINIAPMHKQINQSSRLSIKYTILTKKKKCNISEMHLEL